jgi:hypothetical protein
MTKVRLVAEDVKLYNIDPRKLTSDCMTVIRMDGVVDVVRSYKMVDVFDMYHDLGIKLKKIELCGGVLNPKNQNPCL